MIDTGDNRTPPRHEPLLQLRKVNLVYRALPALRDISWSLEPGRCR